MNAVVNLAEKLTRSLGAANRRHGQWAGLHVGHVQGEYERHTHQDTDDVFLVLKGELDIALEQGQRVTVRSGELFVVRLGVAHQPIANEEVHLLLIERSGAPNSGNPATAAPRRFL